MSSILTSTKKKLGIAEEYKHFDSDIIAHINSVFMDLQQLGVGPEDGFVISDDSSTWEDFVPEEDKRFSAIPTYVYLKVKLLFDIQSMSSAHIEAANRQIDRLEWRLNVAAETF